MQTIGLPSWLSNTTTVLAAWGLLGAFLGVVLWLWRKPGKAIPWWWWITSGVFLALGAVGNAGWLQGVVLVVGGISIGVGLAIVVPEYRAGDVRLRRRLWAEELLTDDLAAGVSRVWHGHAHAKFDGLDSSEPYVDFDITLYNSSLYRARVEIPVGGHVVLDSGTIARPPEMFEVRFAGVGRRSVGPPYTGDIWIEHGEWCILGLRQYLVADKAAALRAARGKEAFFGFDRVDIGVRLAIPDRSGRNVTLGDRQSVRLEGVNLLIPQKAQ